MCVCVPACVCTCIDTIKSVYPKDMMEEIITFNFRPFQFIDCYTGEPNDVLDEDCLEMRPSFGFRWNDAPCH